MGYERFSAKIFSRSFLVVKGALAGPAGGSLGYSRRQPTSDGMIFPESMSEVLSFNPGPVVRRSRTLYHRAATVFWQENVSILIHGFMAVTLCPDASTGSGRSRRVAGLSDQRRRGYRNANSRA
jgi:hypothetical protein